MNDFDLRNNPECSFGDLKWNKYYWEYRRGTSTGQGDYWDEKPDPDNELKSFEDGAWQKSKRYCDILKYIESLTGGKVLDVGCGPGFLLEELGTKWEKYGVDNSPKAIELASKHSHTYCQDFMDVDFESLKFDLVISNHVIEHMLDPIAFIQKIKEILSRGGTLIVGTPDFDGGCARRFGHNYRLLHDPTHVSLFTSFSLVHMLEDYGFDIKKVNYPFFNTEWFTRLNMQKMFDVNSISPPFYGNFIEIYVTNQ